ncbi:MAG: permease prefix domain 1-containing protein [Oscillospiraceae bacterium]|nr:permease prefix domain 1-containing protein [Oscillospiraceae bacterium]
MQKFMSDYLDEVCTNIRGKTVRQVARGELFDHMKERYAGLLDEGLTEEAATLETVKRMGDPETLGRRITAANRSVSELIILCMGFILTALIFIGVLAALGAEFEWFIDTISFIVVLGFSAVYGFLYCGRKLSLINFLSGVKTGALYAGAVSCILGVMTVLHRIGENPDSIGYVISIAMVSLLYGFLISAAARIAERRLLPTGDGVIRGLIE